MIQFFKGSEDLLVSELHIGNLINHRDSIVFQCLIDQLEQHLFIFYKLGTILSESQQCPEAGNWTVRRRGVKSSIDSQGPAGPDLSADASAWYPFEARIAVGL